MSKNKHDPGTLGYRLMAPFMRPLFRLWYNPTVIDGNKIPKEGTIVIASNHKHVYDQCLQIIATKRPINYMAKKEYFEGKLKGFFKLAGCIPVNRNGHDSEATRAALAVLERQGAIGIFPEGTRNKTDAFMLPFKFGAVSLAKKTNALVVPVAVSGDFVFRSKNLVARFGDPFSVENMTIEEANAKLYEEVSKLLRQNLEMQEKKLKNIG